MQYKKCYGLVWRQSVGNDLAGDVLPRLIYRLIITLIMIQKNEFKNADFDYIKKEWNERSECRIYNIIANDDAESLHEITANPEFDINMKIEKFEYEPNAMIKKYSEWSREMEKISLVALSAYFGSIRCFKYLITNNANEKDAMKFAIAGGNIEIIRLCEKITRDWECAASIAVRYHMNNVFEWIFDNYLDKTNDHDFFIDCSISNNVKLTYFFVSHGLSSKSTIMIIDRKTKFYDALDYAANNGNKEVLSILEQLQRPKKPEKIKRKRDHKIISNRDSSINNKKE